MFDKRHKKLKKAQLFVKKVWKRHCECLDNGLNTNYGFNYKILHKYNVIDIIYNLLKSFGSIILSIVSLILLLLVPLHFIAQNEQRKMIYFVSKTFLYQKYTPMSFFYRSFLKFRQNKSHVLLRGIQYTVYCKKIHFQKIDKKKARSKKRHGDV